MTQKTRIQPLPPKRAGLLIRALYRIAKRRFGEVPEPFTVTAHHRRLLIANVDPVVQVAPPLISGQPEFDTIETILRSVLTDTGRKYLHL